MTLTSNIVVDLASQTLVLTCTSGGFTVELLTYNNANQSILIKKREPITITGAEFMAFVTQVNLFQAAILFNYSPNISLTVPFGQMIVNEFHDVGPETWSLTITPLTGSNVCEYTATLASFDIVMAERNPDKTIDFPEWLVFLTSLNHYRLSIRNYLGL